MKIAILETAHFQYALTQAEIFSDAEIFIITMEDCNEEPIKNLLTANPVQGFSTVIIS